MMWGVGRLAWRACEMRHSAGRARSSILVPRDAGYVHVRLARLHRRVRGTRKGGRPWRATGQLGPVASSCRAAWPWPASACSPAAASRSAQRRSRRGSTASASCRAAARRRTHLAAFRQGLRELGYVEGQDVALEVRYAEGEEERYPELAAELVRLDVDVIVTGGSAAILAAGQATTTIPIVFAATGDPVADGLVASLARPGGNVTGLTTISARSTRSAWSCSRRPSQDCPAWPMLWNQSGGPPFSETEAAAQRLSVHVLSLELRSPDRAGYGPGRRKPPSASTAS